MEELVAVIIELIVSSQTFGFIGDSLRKEIALHLIDIFDSINTSYTIRLRHMLCHSKWAVKWSVYPEGENMPSLIVSVDLSFVGDDILKSIPKEFPLENNLIAPIHAFFDGFLGAREALAEVLKKGIIIRVKR